MMKKQTICKTNVQNRTRFNIFFSNLTAFSILFTTFAPVIRKKQ